MSHNPDNLNELFRNHYSELLSWCHKRLRRSEDAEVVVHEAYLRCARRWNHTRCSRDRTVAYLYRAARWSLIDVFRRQQRQGWSNDSHQQTVEHRHTLPWSQLLLGEAIATLPPRERQICLALCAGRNLAEIQHELGLSPGALAVYLCRARRSLEVALGCCRTG